ncbi:hypothetical protein ILUMI_11998 [Ignelater luminosus]|uniref:DNA-directed DNA polymerase n=1 Tax=Ignelater luminosus TaxID=2038154 RepID=A0A8K0D3V1_IGNLU|nr:hypothetical protein ILUMI_11998 [Ignelater luminosus]
MSTHDRFEIVSEYDNKTKKFNVFKKTVVFKIKEAVENEDILEWIKCATEDVFTHMFKVVKSTDIIGLTFYSENFKEKQPGWLSLRSASKVSFDDVWKVLGAILQSNSETLSTDKFKIVLTRVIPPTGKGRQRKYNNFNEFCKKKKGIVTIENRDNLCLLMAICVAKSLAEKDPLYDNIRRNKRRQHKEALELNEKIGNMTIPKNGCGIPELKLIQNYLKKFRIIVYIHGAKGRRVMFDGENENAKYKINLLYHKNHYNVITSLTSAFTCSYFCEDCRVPYNERNKHRCSKSCPCCQEQPPCEKQKQEIKCSNCNREFRNEKCFENHKKTLCKIVKKCKDCFKTYKERDKPHVCGEFYCKVCQDFKQDHLCYMRVAKKPKLKNTLFVFFDLETRQEKLKSDNSYVKIHEPNLCVTMHCCSECYENYELKTCNKCDNRENIFFEDNCISKFIDYLMEIRTKFNRVVCIAHNGQAFDTQFILQYVFRQTHHVPKLIMRGLKVLKLEIENVVFLDSLCYFPMALSALPKTFGLPVDIKKGYFPHLFNTIDNKDYVGSLPPEEFYDPDSMKTEDRDKFLQWYKETKSNNYNFNLKNELIEYCQSDVDILRRACIMFRNLLMKECNVCPFSEAMTIASTCNLAFKRNFLKPDTIGILPKNGYRYADKQSKVAIKWLIWEEKRRNISIQHAANHREVKIPNNMKVDGYCQATNQVFEFFGCYYHGCPKCITKRRDDPENETDYDTLNERYKNTKLKVEKLKSLGYEVVEMWECEFQNIINSNPEINDIDNHFLIIQAPLNPRDAFYGGRTETVRSRYDAKENEKIKYVDVCSLYPWVCKYGKFPKGHPELSIGEDECKRLIKENGGLKQLNGLIKCTVLPPQDLFHPVLPIKMHNKLMFTLCRTCTKTSIENQDECNHSREERTLTGVWVIEEIKKAVEKGYEILSVYEIWNYETETYDKTNDGLFTEYINKFLKMKQEASGWPSDCETSEERDKYIQNYLKHEGILLDRDNIEKNPGRRTLAKLMLNSFWGKFGQRENQPKTEVIEDESKFFELLCDEKIVVNQIQEIDEERIIVNWEFKEDEVEPSTVTNVVIAAHVTALARLKLYSFLEKVEERVLYCDTDSVIYILKNGFEDLPVGHFLGDLTDELEEEYGTGSYITQFASGGPKNYGFNVFSTKTGKIHSKCKVKGITLNHKNSEKVNFDTLLRIATNKEDEAIIVECTSIRPTKDYEVITQKGSKTVRCCITKRRMVNDYGTEPFGYRKRLKLDTSSNATCSSAI